MDPLDKISQILRTDKDNIKKIEEVLSGIVGHDDVLSKIVEENNAKMKKVFDELGIPSQNARDIFLFLISKIKRDDTKLTNLFQLETKGERSEFENIVNFARQTSEVKRSYSLKLEKARELIVKNPPQNIIKFLGYSGAKELVEKEDIFEIFAALRFVEGMDWMNKVFLKDYDELTVDDFEEREITVKVLSDKWKSAAEKFIKKKYHNLSHSKELGLVFIVPLKLGISGVNFMDFALALHYFHEVDFYSNLFRKYARDEKANDGNSEFNFAGKVISALRGDVPDIRPDENRLGKDWIITQRYLAKVDNYDWRLFYPHINPEALHWAKVEKDIARFSEKVGLELEFWKDLGFVGDFYKDESGVEVLVSFNFLDTTMALFKEKEMIKYLYHHQEAMWNKLFSGFLGEKKMEELIIENFDKGIIRLD
jgi:hypothetical protein